MPDTVNLHNVSILTENDLHNLYSWVDSIPLTHPKQNINRDFSDGCCVAEIVHHFFPRLVELHNYTPTHNTAEKLANWKVLNDKVFHKMLFEVPEGEVKDIASAVPGAIERFLRALRVRIAQIERKQEEIGFQFRDGREGVGEECVSESSRRKKRKEGNGYRMRGRSLPGRGSSEPRSQRRVAGGNQTVDASNVMGGSHRRPSPSQQREKMKELSRPLRGTPPSREGGVVGFMPYYTPKQQPQYQEAVYTDRGKVQNPALQQRVPVLSRSPRLKQRVIYSNSDIDNNDLRYDEDDITVGDSVGNSREGYQSFNVRSALRDAHEEKGVYDLPPRELMIIRYLSRQLAETQTQLNDKTGTITELKEAIAILSEKAVRLERALRKRDQEVKELVNIIGNR